MKAWWIALALATIAAAAAARDFPLPTVTEAVGGVPVTFSGRASLVPAPSCQSLGASVVVDISDLARKATEIADRSGIERSESCGDGVAIHAVHLDREGEHLRVKVDGAVSRQECVVTKVPEFRGLEVTMKNRTVASNTFSTNASVTVVFDPVVEDGAELRLVPVGTPELSVSNDVYRFLLDATGYGRDVERKLRRAAQDALAAENAILALPPPVARFGLRLDDARIVEEEGRLGLRVDGTVPIPSGQGATIYGALGLDTAGCR